MKIIIDVNLATVVHDSEDKRSDVEKTRYWCAYLSTIDQEKDVHDVDYKTDGVHPRGWGKTQQEAIAVLTEMLRMMLGRVEEVADEIAAKPTEGPKS